LTWRANVIDRMLFVLFFSHILILIVNPAVFLRRCQIYSSVVAGETYASCYA